MKPSTTFLKVNTLEEHQLDLVGHLTTESTTGACIYTGEGLAVELHLIVAAATDADMQTPDDVPIYRIQTVSALTGISARRIRNWDTEHELVRPARTKGGHRLYSTREVKGLREIRRLMEDEGLSLQAVRVWWDAQIEDQRRPCHNGPERGVATDSTSTSLTASITE
jgi:DNA-binding transcriptional MerR regulator